MGIRKFPVSYGFHGISMDRQEFPMGKPRGISVRDTGVQVILNSPASRHIGILLEFCGSAKSAAGSLPFVPQKTETINNQTSVLFRIRTVLSRSPGYVILRIRAAVGWSCLR